MLTSSNKGLYWKSTRGKLSFEIEPFVGDTMLIMWSYFTYYRGERKMERMDACSGPYERMCWPHVFFLGYFSLEWLSRAREYGRGR